MAEELCAIPEVLRQIGTQLADHGDSLLALQQFCRGQIADAQAGWIGSSASALSALIDGWASASSAHLLGFTHQSAGMHLAAAEFNVLDQRNADALR